MNTLILISVLPILLLYLGLYGAKRALLPVTVIGLLAALGLAILRWNDFAAPIYHGMMLFDRFAIAFSGVCIISTILILMLSGDYFERISSHVAEYYAIILFSLAGIVVMVSFHNLTMLFIGIEIMSVSLYILAGIRKNDFASNEAALKYFLMGAFSTGFLLFGITLVYGAVGSFDLTVIRDWALTHTSKTADPLFYAGILLMVIGLCFKVGAAPFHFWTPDVYEGSPTLITAYMSTVAKTAGFAAFLRLFSTCFASVSDVWQPALVAITIVTLFIGNITALYQHSFKRMLAFSSISHAGYLMFAIVALGVNSANALLVYGAAYSVASITAFAVLILVNRQSGNDDFEGFNGLGKSNPFLALVLTIAMLSLAGIPLTAGFIGKFYMFTGAVSKLQIWLVVIAVINAIISIFYYFRVIVAMYFRGNERNELTVPGYYGAVLALSALITIIIGIFPGFITSLIR